MKTHTPEQELELKWLIVKWMNEAAHMTPERYADLMRADEETRLSGDWWD